MCSKRGHIADVVAGVEVDRSIVGVHCLGINEGDVAALVSLFCGTNRKRNAPESADMADNDSREPHGINGHDIELVPVVLE